MGFDKNYSSSLNSIWFLDPGASNPMIEAYLGLSSYNLILKRIITADGVNFLYLVKVICYIHS